MYKKIYLSRAQTRAMSAEYPIGDPFGGAAYGEYNDPVTAVVAGGASLLGSVIQGNAAKSAAQTQADAGSNAQNQLLATGAQASQQYTPYTDIGKTALSSLSNQMPYFNQQFSNQDLNAQLAPNYAFQLQQGQAGQNAAANATGGLVGGNAQQALSQFNQNYAANAYQQAFNNFQAQRTNIYNQNLGLANLGLTGAQGTANAQLGTGSNIANITQGIGNAQAASQIGQANAYAGGIQNVGNLYALSSLIGKGSGGGETLLA
jgi:hypothetical protein